MLTPILKMALPLAGFVIESVIALASAEPVVAVVDQLSAR